MTKILFTFVVLLGMQTATNAQTSKTPVGASRPASPASMDKAEKKPLAPTKDVKSNVVARPPFHGSHSGPAHVPPPPGHNTPSGPNPVPPPHGHHNTHGGPAPVPPPPGHK